MIGGGHVGYWGGTDIDITRVQPGVVVEVSAENAFDAPVRDTNVDHIVVEPRPDGRWARQRNGTKRAASLHDTQAEAEAADRAQARRWHTELVVKGEDGRILRRDSYGDDPARRPG